jgi:hypothetical protein
MNPDRDEYVKAIVACFLCVLMLTFVLFYLIGVFEI